MNLELNTTFIQITQPHCKRKSKSTRLVQNIGQFCLLMKPFSKHVNLLQSCKVKLRRSWMRLLLLEKAANLSAILLKEKLGDFFIGSKFLSAPNCPPTYSGNPPILSSELLQESSFYKFGHQPTVGIHQFCPPNCCGNPLYNQHT